MTKTCVIAWIVAFVLMFLGGYVVHELLLHDLYASTGLMRAPEEAQGMMGWMILAHVLMAGAFVWIYSRGVENKPWLAQGLRFGLAMAVFCTIPMFMIYYVVQPTPAELAVKQIVFDTICTLIVGAVVAFLYRGQGRA